MTWDDIEPFLLSEGCKCACIEMFDGRIIEINCGARCHDGN